MTELVCVDCGAEPAACWCPCPRCGLSSTAKPGTPEACGCSYEVLVAHLRFAQKERIDAGQYFADRLEESERVAGEIRRELDAKLAEYEHRLRWAAAYLRTMGHDPAYAMKAVINGIHETLGEAPPGYFEKLTEAVRAAPKLPDDEFRDTSGYPDPL